ncbi:GNAT family N-acetyltransferase [Halobacillus litoralis]|uniref:GNAT family N-acetyltransferase n=1 Tax=Halobacillus litoralis TaxID=45668 RepID=UPI001CD1D1DE|nr:GNAT family N-acetyltransferase [Halobacillus litoralis]MCA0968991.1 GNAT family N-acetyltransferase [Halobacillus litoralis]
MVTLRGLTQGEFDSVMKDEMKHYAGEKVKAGTWTEDEAMTLSKETFQNLLPDGHKTRHHDFLGIDHDDVFIGYFWYNFDPEHKQKQAFIYNFLIFESEQGKGYGEAALRALESYLKGQGVDKLALHVFGHNQRAINLYKKLEFQVTNINMSKQL